MRMTRRIICSLSVLLPVMSELDDVADQRSKVLRWIHSRLGHSFTVFRGHEIFEGVLVRGREPAFRADDDADSYVLDVFAPIASFRIDARHLDDVEFFDEGNLLRLTFSSGDLVEISDEG